MIDGFSTDDTRQVAVKAGASLVIQQPSNKFPGKGMAMKAGLETAIKAEVDAIVFLDGDIKNLAPEWVDLLSEPVLSRGYDMARGYYLSATWSNARPGRAGSASDIMKTSLGWPVSE